MKPRLVRDQSPRALAVLVLAILALCSARSALAQNSTSTPWSFGIDAMVANPLRIASPFLLGASASRMVLSGSAVGLRVELAAARSLARDDRVCDLSANHVCDLRSFDTIGSFVTSLTVGPAAADRSRGWVYGVASAGAYGTLWSYAASGSGPSGLAFGGGVGVWIPGTLLPLRFETRYLRLDADGRFSLTAGFQYAW